MRREHQREIPCLLERYELKYLIPEEMIEPIADFVSIYCSLDKYSQSSEDGFYTVNSLYLDSPNYVFLKKRLEKLENRFNMRIRTYGNDPQRCCFLEVKQKKANIVKKYRTFVQDESWRERYEFPGCRPPDGIVQDSSHSHLFFRLACSYNATPKVLTQYRRKAYVSDVDDYARVTFDRDLRYQPEEDYNLSPYEDEMVSYDHSAVFDPECNIILELKCCATKVPLWMLDLIRSFHLVRRRFSKYATSVTEALGLFRYGDPYRVAAFLP